MRYSILLPLYMMNSLQLLLFIACILLNLFYALQMCFCRYVNNNLIWIVYFFLSVCIKNNNNNPQKENKLEDFLLSDWKSRYDKKKL